MAFGRFYYLVPSQTHQGASECRAITDLTVYRDVTIRAMAFIARKNLGRDVTTQDLPQDLLALNQQEVDLYKTNENLYFSQMGDFVRKYLSFYQDYIQQGQVTSGLAAQSYSDMLNGYGITAYPGVSSKLKLFQKNFTMTTPAPEAYRAMLGFDRVLGLNAGGVLSQLHQKYYPTPKI